MFGKGKDNEDRMEEVENSNREQSGDRDFIGTYNGTIYHK